MLAPRVRAVAPGLVADVLVVTRVAGGASLGSAVRVVKYTYLHAISRSFTTRGRCGTAARASVDDPAWFRVRDERRASCSTSPWSEMARWTFRSPTSTFGADGGPRSPRRDDADADAASSGVSSSISGSFHTSERRGGVQRRQLELKGVDGGD
jgi:hypothetical protein